ncbi:hypothetical protein Clacol_008462 [Clathrus columnatus]|uniref:BD-FAE-like domain-containing protein n=1 Tax=Clathrus columnatus TaxID=1419009 RepID=A0AAV5AQQ7_9AGAM|nr:hypothetical protein Clacol_008462 [Clathrus columnatus]
METLAKLTEKEDVMATVEPTRKIFEPLLSARQTEIAQTSKRTFQYGSHTLQQLDIYYPSHVQKAPIMFFVHGGGFVAGSKNHIGNIGAFYAKRGIITVLIDYRLAPEVQYPGASEDIRDAVSFVLSSPDVGLTEEMIDKNQVYIQGQSAGGAHTLNFFFEEKLLERQKNQFTCAGTIIIAAAYEGGSYFPMYFGSDPATAEARTPLGLLKVKTSDKAKALLPAKILLLLAENEPTPLVHWDANFRQALQEKGIDFHWEIMKGHNHVSPECALYSGEGEEFGESIVKFIKG